MNLYSIKTQMRWMKMILKFKENFLENMKDKIKKKMKLRRKKITKKAKYQSQGLNVRIV